jgi:TolB protein
MNSYSSKIGPGYLRGLIATFVVLSMGCVLAMADGTQLGDFEAQADVGTVQPPGTATFDPATKTYHITSSGENVWNKHDDFHFVYRKMSGDFSLSADIALSEVGKSAHRKGGCMIRQSLDADSAYVDVMVHGDGLIALQYRTAKGDVTKNLQSTVKAPATVRLERHADTYTLYVGAKEGKAEKGAEVKAMQRVGSVDVKLTDPLYAGLAVTSHDASSSETVAFSNVVCASDGSKPNAPAK